MPVQKKARRKPTPREHAIGVGLSVSVAFIWVGSSELIQYIFGESNFDQPYFFTYVTTSLFGVLLIGFLRRTWRQKLHAPSARISGYSPISAPSVESTIAPDAEMGSGTPFNAMNSEMTSTPPKVLPFNARDIAFVSIIIAPLYFFANYLFNFGLGLTSLSSSSTISTMASLFTLIISVVVGIDKFSVMNLTASLMTIAGNAIIGHQDGERGKSKLVGDALSLVAAFFFAMYTTALKYLVDDVKRVDMGMMFAFLGLFAFLVAWPGLPLLNFLTWERFRLPNWHVLGLMLLNAAVGSILSDILWAKSVVYTSALVGSIGLTLTVPLSIILDSLTGKLRLSPPYIVGVVLVVTGFVLVNVELQKREDKKTVEAHSEITNPAGNNRQINLSE